MSTPTLLRSEIAELVALAAGDLSELWRLVDDFDEAREALMDVLPDLIDTYGLAAATTAADWYDDIREVQGVGGRFSAIAADIPDPGAQALVQWAASEATDLTSMQSLVLGGMQRRIANFSRASVMESSFADPRSEGWMRTGVGSCDFCRMLIGRGAVYDSQTVRFGSHDNCNCQAAPSFGRPSDIFDVDEWRRSTRRDRAEDSAQREASNARARAWIADNL